MLTNQLIRAVLLFSAMGLAPSIIASENYAGTDCKHELGGSDLDFTWNGTVANNSATSSWVTCHIPHTDFDGSFGHNGAIESGFVQVKDFNQSSDICCRFRGPWLEASGTLRVRSTPVGCTKGFGTQRRQINLGSLHEEWNSSYLLSCSIPPKDTQTGLASMIYMYRVNQ